LGSRRRFRDLGRDPTDAELESIAQTWSEHCSHKTLAGRIAYRDENGERRFENMLKETIFAATGQTCVAGSRLLVQFSIREASTEKLLDIARSAKIGDPMRNDTHVGPVTTPPQYQKILDYIEIAKNEGARCILGGKPAEGPEIIGGQFVEPTIFTDVSNDMRIAQEEVFGPVLSIIGFEDEEEAVEEEEEADEEEET